MKKVVLAASLLAVLVSCRVACVEEYSFEDIEGKTVSLARGETLKIDEHTISIDEEGRLAANDQYFLRYDKLLPLINGQMKDIVRKQIEREEPEKADDKEYFEEKFVKSCEQYCFNCAIKSGSSVKLSMTKKNSLNVDSFDLKTTVDLTNISGYFDADGLSSIGSISL